MGVSAGGRRDQVNALGEAQQRSPRRPQLRGGDIEPWAGRVHGQTSPSLDFTTAERIAHYRPRDCPPVISYEPHRGRVVQYHSAFAGSVERVFDDQALYQRDLAVVELPRALE